MTAHPEDPATWRHETARVNGVTLHYVTVPPDPDAIDHPTGVAPLLVLLHGFPSHWYAWRHQLDELAGAGYRVVAPDLRGYNRSSAPEGVDSYSQSELVGDVRGLIEHHGAPRAVVVGHDWGGLIAWETAIREPEIVHQLAVLNAPHPDLFRRTIRRSPTQLVRSWYALAVQLPWLPERVLEAGEYRLLSELFEGSVSPDGFTDAEIERYRAAMERTGSLSGPLNYYRAFARETVDRQLRSLVPGDGPRDGTVESPTLVLWGEQDPVFDSGLFSGLDRWTENLRVRRFPNAGHWIHVDRRAAVTDELLSFVATR